MLLPPTPLPTPCQEWEGPITKEGYGRRSAAQGGTKLVHRWVIEQIDGPIPEGMVVMHLCDNRRCYRYDHLKVGTLAENNADAKAKGRNAKGERVAQSVLTADQVAEIRRRLLAGEKHAALALAFGVSRRTIGHINTNETWRHVPWAA